MEDSSVQFSHSVMSNSLWPHGLQHARPPCPSPTPGVHPNSCPLSWSCHLCHLLLLLLLIFPSTRVLSNDSVLHIRKILRDENNRTLTCLLRNLYAGQEAKLELDMKQWTCSKLGKVYVNAVYYHSAYLISMQSTLCKMPGYMTHKLDSRLLEEISTTLDMQITLL